MSKKETMMRRKDFRGDQECSGADLWMRSRIVRS